MGGIERDNIFLLTGELIREQQKLLLRLGRRLVPTLTPEDVLQPNDYPELENHPVFRYEEGVLAGMLSMESALRARLREIQEQSVDNCRPA